MSATPLEYAVLAATRSVRLLKTPESEARWRRSSTKSIACPQCRGEIGMHVVLKLVSWIALHDYITYYADTDAIEVPEFEVLFSYRCKENKLLCWSASGRMTKSKLSCLIALAIYVFEASLPLSDFQVAPRKVALVPPLA